MGSQSFIKHFVYDFHCIFDRHFEKNGSYLLRIELLADLKWSERNFSYYEMRCDAIIIEPMCYL